MSRTSKISRLPRPIREQLNQRLDNGEQNKRVVQWLNSLPEVQQVLAAEFDGVPLVQLCQLEALVQLTFEIVISHLLQNVCVRRLVNLECFSAMWTANFMHGHSPIPTSVIVPV